MALRATRAVVGGALALTAAGLAARALKARKRQQVLAEALGPEAARARHAAKVERIARALRERTSTAPVTLLKKSPSHMVPKNWDVRYGGEKIDVSDLDQILAIDPVARTCTAEAGVTYVDLVEATLKHGLVPIVVPELKTITIGGAVSGCSIESMSYKFGGFHDTCTEYEVITAKGEVLTCTPENEHQLIFQMMHGSFGTLGVLSKLTFKLVPATPYVKMRYEKYRTVAEYKAAIERHYRARDVDFMDGIIHSPTEYVLSLGNFVDSAPYTHSYDWTRVYYQSTRELQEDYLRTADYFFRYDRGVTNVHPRSFLGRLLIGKFLGSSELLSLARKFHWALPKEKPDVILDVFLPFSAADEFLAWYEREFDFTPLWCVPYKRVRDYEWLADGFFRGRNDELFLDIAIYGMKQKDDRNYYRMIEEKLIELGGIKTLISHNFYSEQEFWKTWNKPNYDAVKARVDPDNIFRNLFDKMVGRPKPERAAHHIPSAPPPISVHEAPAPRPAWDERPSHDAGSDAHPA